MQNDQNQNPARPESTGINPVHRHNARRYALQAMYQWQIADTALIDIENEFLHYHIDQKLDFAYFKELLYGVPTNLHELDNAIMPFIGRPKSEIDPIELAVLRLSTYELLKHPEIPYRVIINEALELCKKFGTVQGHKFVNAVLDKVARKVRETEINMKK